MIWIHKSRPEIPSFVEILKEMGPLQNPEFQNPDRGFEIRGFEFGGFFYLLFNLIFIFYFLGFENTEK